MREIKVEVPTEREGSAPLIIETNEEEVQFLWEILKDLEAWDEYFLPIKVSSNHFSLTLEHNIDDNQENQNHQYNNWNTSKKLSQENPKPQYDHQGRKCVKCHNPIIKDIPYTYKGIEPLCQNCYEELA